MVKNLSQLKKSLKRGTDIEIIAHCRSEYAGQKRRIMQVNTQGFYSIVPGELENEVTLANDGKGNILWWEKASFWEFKNDICSVYCNDSEHTERYLIMSFRIIEQEVA